MNCNHVADVVGSNAGNCIFCRAEDPDEWTTCPVRKERYDGALTAASAALRKLTDRDLYDLHSARLSSEVEEAVYGMIEDGYWRHRKSLKEDS